MTVDASNQGPQRPDGRATPPRGGKAPPSPPHAPVPPAPGPPLPGAPPPPRDITAAAAALRGAASRPSFGGSELPVDARQRVFGDYVIEREIGRGGMGVVWLATQRSLGRRVALKVLPNFAAMDASAVLRFRREAEATGRIAHPGIVPVYGVGEVDGIHYFAMEFVDGPPLGTILDQLSLRQADLLRESWVEEALLVDRYPSLREPPATGAGNRYVRSCARLCADVANALAAAHLARVIHRDLKPNNILIHPAGRPVLVDFGLARDEQQGSLTRTGEQLGTPGYMAPEQARGHRQIDHRADIYGLGAVLYELLSLRPPFEGTTSAEIAHKILTEEPMSLRRRNANVPIDLAAIVHRCLAKAPDERYPAIEALELDLRNFLAGRPVAAGLPGTVARVHGALQRHRQSLMIGTSAALVATVIAVAAGLVDDRNDVEHGRQALVEARRMLVDARNPERARDLYERAAALTKDPDGVREQRRRDFRSAFSAYYEDKPAGPQTLRRFAAVFDDADQHALADLLARLDGRGRLHFASRALEQATRTLEARQVTADGLQAEWSPVHQDQPLPIGEYLLRATSTDGTVAVIKARVQADEDATIEPRYLDAAELPPAHAAVVDPQYSRTLAVAQYEVTRAQWRAFLDAIADPLLRAEMTPLQWDGGLPDANLPVRGLSFLQARAFAVSNGAHLPTPREQWLAGSAGLQGLTMPWGGAADAGRLCADPFQRSGPVAVDAMPAGQSPLGIYHVLGNVAEVLSAAADAPLAVGGGSYLDEPKTLVLDGAHGTVPVALLPAIDRGHAGVGMRLYRFVAPADDQKAEAQAQQRREDLRGGVLQSGAQKGCVFHDWTLQRDGTMDFELEINGAYDGGLRRQLPHFDTPGYLQVPGTVRALDGHRQELGGGAVIAAGAEASVVEVALPDALRQGQGYRYYIDAKLQPAGGLRPSRDGYTLRLPMKRGYGVPQVYTLILPADCAVEEVTPTPTMWTVGGKTKLSWEHTASEQIETAVVHLRADGTFGRVLATRAAADKRCRQFLDAWSDRSGLDALLDRDFVRQPGGCDRDAALARRAGEKFTLVRLVDTVRIGDIETTEVVVDWHMQDRAGRPFVLEGWTMLLQWRHDGSNARVVRFQPFTQADQGRFDGDAGYWHERMRVRIDPVPQTSLVRTQEELCELQVKVACKGLTAQILGCFADANETTDAIRFRLTNGASMLRTGQLRADLGTADGTVQEWVFGGADVASRERWVFVQRGSRHLLLRFAAADRDPAQAEAMFQAAAAQDWFAAVQAALHVK